jgi:WD40 repeat protein/serine/threonine protein kinase
MAFACDHNLIFGLLALQMDFVTRVQLLDAMAAWMLDKQTPLGELLCRRGVLAANDRIAIDGLVERHIARHGNPQASLAALRVEPAVRHDLGRLNDPEVQASLAGLPPQDSPATGGGRAEEFFSVLATTAPVGDAAFSVRFRRLREHAKGGLGEVFVALDGELDREVALKEIQARHADHPESRARFLTEARVTGALEHPGIVPVYGLGIYPDGRPYYAMRFIKGDSLKDAIETFHAGRSREPSGTEESAARLAAPTFGSLAFRQLLRRFVDVCNAIAYAQDKGVIHRDLKPANVMLGKFGETLVVDWGLAKVMGQADVEATTASVLVRSGDSSLTQAGQALGTPAFMSPEQAAGRLDRVGPASDTYSLGATLYCLLTGKASFTEKDVGAVLARVQKGDFKPPRQVNASVPSALEAVCLKSMALKAQDRYSSARELAEEIEHWLADEPVKAYPEPRRARLARWGRRHRPLVAGAAALLLTAVVALSLGLVLLGRANTEIREAKQQAENRGDQLAALNDTLLRANYIADMNLARVAWDENNLVRGRELLDRYRSHTGEKDLRGFEWYYLRRLLHGQELLVKAHAGWISAVAFTPDGKRLISSGESARHNAFQLYSRDTKGEAKQWDAATGQPLPLQLKGQAGSTDTLTVFGDRVERIALNRDGTRMAVSCRDHAIRVWEFATGKPTLLEGPAKHIAAGLHFSPDGRCLLSLYRSDDYRTDKRISIRIWDLATRKATVALNQLPHLSQEGSFSPDGRHFAVCCGILGVVKVWDATTGAEAYSCPYAGGYVDIAVFSPDGRCLAACGQNGVQIWDAATHRALSTWKSDSGFVHGLTFSSDGKRLATGSAEGAVEVWDTQTGQKLHTFKGHAGGVDNLAFSPDGTRLVTGGMDGTLRWWNTTEQRDVISIPKTDLNLIVAYPELSPDGRTVFMRASGDGKAIRLWNVQTGEPRGGLIQLRQGVGVLGRAWTADGKHLYLQDKGGQVVVVDTAAGKVIRAFAIDSDARYSAIALTPDEKWCAHAVGPMGRTIKVRNARTGAEVRSLKALDARVYCLNFSPDGSRLLVADEEQTLKICDVDSGNEIAATKLPSMSINRPAFSPDGKRVAIFGNRSRLLTGELRVLDSGNLREVWSLQGHTLNVTDAVFSPDGQRLATASSDRTIRVWDLTAGQEVLKLNGSAPIWRLRFTSDGRRLISASIDRTIRIWDATPLPE